ncbi:Zinc-finger double-stranded RNA-binding, putative [Trypanosoma equiperdum]|uniref:C2H2-type domain-containing protein n=3 Tax=Trypanozoon TaxID=39700 RepID=C9ZL55_TRYB9|nr:hypothetical protein, conserved [Trypanosoma brucei gambiense DAL972]RHW73713.1 Zinc-finger double-stranded RNA-binding [Trypanosoma brucei equiperdum]CBH10064.1 hypothetical protein, conserved [Trypanosoma brucei gambiense DAL972]SCU66074.1 Zinc-finger double-stranded RNA-binding, putative [Trypanosoma equiperdum]|eukprot:XP_011772354.1 hypothetical protein, conserved [Trypanosoma brucei gambiense DAL972]
MRNIWVSVSNGHGHGQGAAVPATDNSSISADSSPPCTKRMRRYIAPTSVDLQRCRKEEPIPMPMPAPSPSTMLSAKQWPQHMLQGRVHVAATCGQPTVTVGSKLIPPFSTATVRVGGPTFRAGVTVSAPLQPVPFQGHQSQEPRGKHLCVRMYLPQSDPPLQSWCDVHPNPLIGLPGRVTNAPPMEREPPKYFCDPCQKGYNTQEQYDRHMKTHIWCSFPGCKFTCLQSREWKMEAHIETLHNRPDAPNLSDVGAYLAQRRGRFPTQDSVKAKMEELFYKASRGVVLPDDRRRWLRQHGILVGKRPRTGESYIVTSASRNAKKVVCSESEDVKANEGRADTSDAPETQRVCEEGCSGASDSSQCDGNRLRNKEDPSVSVGRGGECESADCTGSAIEHRQHKQKDHSRPRRIIPCGPNGSLSNAQKVQLIRERYREAKTVPRFYVCSCCGEKGQHWVTDCPKRSDQVFERRIVWGEERRDPPKPKLRDDNIVPAMTSCSEGNAVVDETAAGPSSGDVEVTSDVAEPWVEDVGPPPELPARRACSEEDSRVPNNAAEGRGGATHKCGVKEERRQRAQRRDHRRVPPPPPTLFERLTEDRNSVEHGLLLQAIRFFVKSNFFEPR